MSQNLIDVTPLPAPVNACKWNAAQLRAQLKAAVVTEPARTRIEQSAAWLDELAKHVPFAHTNPILLLAVGNLALSMKDRDQVTGALQVISALTVKAQSGQPLNGAPAPAATPWAPVEP